MHLIIYIMSSSNGFLVITLFLQPDPESENNEIKLTNKFKAFFAILFPNQDIF